MFTIPSCTMSNTRIDSLPALSHLILVALLLGTALGGMAAATPHHPSQTPEIRPWWESTVMDRDGNRIHDALDLALHSPEYVHDGRIGVLVDFDHTPTDADEQMLIDNVGFVPRFRFTSIDIISGTVEVERIPDLLALPGVVFLSLNGKVSLLMNSVVPEHHVDIVWDLGFTGEGMSIAVIDTGIDAEHVGLNDMDDDPTTFDPKVIAFYDAVNDPLTRDGSTPPYDDQGHGTHCAAIAAGTGEEDTLEQDGQDNNRYMGVAPGAYLIGVKVLDAGGSGTFDQVMAGMQWCIDYREEFNIRAATMSLGGFAIIELTQAQEERLSELANTMIAEGIALTIAAGNSAHYGSIGTPANARDVITVGATEKNRDTAPYSSRGPTAEGLVKPNVAAIGSGVMSAQANSRNGYVAYSGTSMATPVVAGIMTLMLQANPDLDPLTLRSILEYTAEYRWLTHPVRPNNDFGWGFVEADAALDMAIDLDPNLKVNIHQDTETREYRGDNSTGVQVRYLAHMGEELTFLVEGNSLGLEWRSVDADSWYRVNQLRPGSIDIPLMEQYITPGNHSIWVRAYGDDGISAPLYLLVEIAPARARDDSDDGNEALYIGFSIILIVVLMAAFMILRRKRLNEPEGDDDLSPGDTDMYGDESSDDGFGVGEPGVQGDDGGTEVYEEPEDSGP